MKGFIVALMGPVMMMFLLAGIQTIEWSLDSGTKVPWQAYALLACVVVWCIAAFTVTREDWHKVNRFFERLTDESKKKQSR